MIQQEKRVRIAEACEFKPLEFVPPKRGEFILEQNNFRRWKKAGKTFHTDDLPDYFKDLNAMHEAEKVLTENVTYMQRHAFNNYAYRLIEMCKHQCNAVSATAAQRAEAFGKTLDLW